MIAISALQSIVNVCPCFYFIMNSIHIFHGVFVHYHNLLLFDADYDVEMLMLLLCYVVFWSFLGVVYIHLLLSLSLSLSLSLFIQSSSSIYSQWTNDFPSSFFLFGLSTSKLQYHPFTI